MPTFCEVNGSNRLMIKLYSKIGGSNKYCPKREVTIEGVNYIVHKDKTEVSTLYTKTTNWKAPDGVKQILLEIVGGGGSGASHTQHTTFVTGGCGGAGGYFKGYVNVTPGTNYSLVVGSGGAGVPINGESGIDGNDGSASKFGSFVTCDGGKKGVSYYTTIDGIRAHGGNGGAVTLGSNIAQVLINQPGEAGHAGEYIYKRDPKYHAGNSGWRTHTSSSKPYYGKGGDGGRTSFNSYTDATFDNGDNMSAGHSESGAPGAIKITYYKYGGKYV